MSDEVNLRLIREIEANRAFLLSTLAQNPALRARQAAHPGAVPAFAGAGLDTKRQFG